MLKQDHNTKVEALKLCESTCRERDMCPGDNPKLANKVNFAADKLLNTHFRILVVSPAFERLDSNGRAALVYNELLKTLGKQPIPALTLDSTTAHTPVMIQSRQGSVLESGSESLGVGVGGIVAGRNSPNSPNSSNSDINDCDTISVDSQA